MVAPLAMQVLRKGPRSLACLVLGGPCPVFLRGGRLLLSLSLIDRGADGVGGGASAPGEATRLQRRTAGIVRRHYSTISCADHCGLCYHSRYLFLILLNLRRGRGGVPWVFCWVCRCSFVGWFSQLSLAAGHREDHLILWSLLLQSCVHVEVKRRVGRGSRFCAQGSEIQVVTLARAAWRQADASKLLPRL